MTIQVRAEILAMCDLIDRHFIFEVGPFGEFVIEETREKWLETSKAATAGHVLGYIRLLAAHIAEPSKRDNFLGNARGSLFKLPGL